MNLSQSKQHFPYMMFLATKSTAGPLKLDATNNWIQQGRLTLPETNIAPKNGGFQ